MPAQAIKTGFLLQLNLKGKVTCIIVYRVPFFGEYFIVTKNVAKNGTIGYNKNSLFIFLFIFCKELAKKVHFVWNKNIFFMKIFVLSKVPT